MYVLTQPVCALTHETTPKWSGFLTKINTSKYMLDEKLQLRIDLLQDQIDNLEKSGYYTDEEIKTQTKPLQIELAIIKDSLSFEFLTVAELRELQNRINHAIVTRHSVSGKTIIPIFSGLLASLKKGANDFIFPNAYGMDQKSYEQGKKFHELYFAPLKALHIEVVDAQILTPNHQEA